MRYRAGLKTRTRILAATRDLVGERGLHGTTIKAICERAGILAGSFYNLFASKEEAVLTVLREAIQAVEPSPEDSSDIGALVSAYVTFVGEQEALARVYIEVAITSRVGDPALHSRMKRHHERRLEIFSNALEAAGVEEPGEMAELLLAALNGMALQRLVDKSYDMAGHAFKLLELAPQPASRTDS